MGCSVGRWSAVTSATPNATLAGVLAGFLLNAIILVLTRGPAGFGQVRALSFLFAAFVALALDSYLFGLVTGDHTCRRAWTEAMLAAGLLGLGAVAIIAGFALLMAEYIPTGEIPESKQLLDTLFNVLRGGVALVVLTAFFMTSWNFLYSVLGDGVPGYAKLFLRIYAFAIGFLAVLAVIITSVHPDSSNRFWKSWKRLSTGWRNLYTQKLEVDSSEEKGNKQPRQLGPATYSTLVYTILSVMFASLVASSSARDWSPASVWVKIAVPGTIVWVLLISLIPLFFLLVRSVPSFTAESVRGRS